jgi:hypothetical protein
MNDTGPDRADDDTAGQRRQMWRSVTDIAALVGPVSLLTGVLYYFGYVSAGAFYAYFGVNLSVLDFSTTSYLLRTADAFFRPLATLLIVLVVLLVAHQLLTYGLARADARWARVTAGVLGVIGGLLVAVGVSGLYGRPYGVWSPLALAAAAVVPEYTTWTACRYEILPTRLTTAVQASTRPRQGLGVAVLLLAVFWAVTDIAAARGTATARLVEMTLRLRPQAVVYSEKDLHLPGPEVGVVALTGTDSAYAFRYNGLRPLLYANDRWFLLPVGWTHDNGATVIVLEDDPGRLRVDLAP